MIISRGVTITNEGWYLTTKQENLIEWHYLNYSNTLTQSISLYISQEGSVAFKIF